MQGADSAVTQEGPQPERPATFSGISSDLIDEHRGRLWRPQLLQLAHNASLRYRVQLHTKARTRRKH